MSFDEKLDQYGNYGMRGACFLAAGLLAAWGILMTGFIWSDLPFVLIGVPGLPWSFLCWLVMPSDSSLVARQFPGGLSLWWLYGSLTVNAILLVILGMRFKPRSR